MLLNAINPHRYGLVSRGNPTSVAGLWVLFILAVLLSMAYSLYGLCDEYLARKTLVDLTSFEGDDLPL